MSNVENDPFIDGLESTMMATMFPTMPRTETVVRRTPEVTNSNRFS
jgi:hypothetical protein